MSRRRDGQVMYNEDTKGKPGINYDTFVKNPFWDGTVTPDPWDEGEDA